MMISLTERQEKISQYLLGSKAPIGIDELSRVFSISTRSVYYDLRRIESWAKIKGLYFQRCPRREVLLTQLDSKNGKPGTLRIVSQETRRKAILLKLLLRSSSLTALDLSEDLGVSRNTILQDIKIIRQELIPPGIRLVGLRSHGYTVQGDEQSIRSLAATLIFTNILTYDLIAVMIKNKHSTDPGLLLELVLTNLRFDEVKMAVKNASLKHDFWLPDMDYVRFIIYQAIAVRRLEMGHELPKGEQELSSIEGYEEFRIAWIVSSDLSERFSLDFSDDEIFNTFTMLLTCNIKTRINAVKFDSPDKLLRKTVAEMIDEISPYISLNRKFYKKLESDLTEHLKLTLKQLQLGVTGENPLLDMIKITYSQSFLLAEKMAAIFKESTGLTLPESEVGYLALHVAVYLEVRGKREEKLQAVVICNAGKGAANILSKKLRIHLPELKIKGTYSIMDLEEQSSILDDVDLIISTINYTHNRKPVLKISPLLSDYEIAIIQNFITNRASFGIGSEQNRSDNLIFNNLYERLAKRTDQETVKIFKEEVERIGLFWNEKFILDGRTNGDELQQSSTTASVFLESMNMVKELKEIGISPSEDGTIGLLIHLIMAVGRWQKGDFTREKDPEEFKSVAPDAWEIVARFLHRVQSNFSQDIPESECVSVMRYLI